MAGVMITAMSSGHLVVAYIYAGNSRDTGAFRSAPQSYIDKALEVAGAIPDFRTAGRLPGIHRSGTGQPDHCSGSWYQVPNGWIELKNLLPTEAYRTGIELQQGCCVWDLSSELIQKLTTGKKRVCQIGELEEGDYTP